MVGHITFEDGDNDLKRVPSNPGEGGSDVPHGVYNLRDHSSLRRRRSSLSLGRAPTFERSETDEDGDGGLRQAGDFKSKQVFKGSQLLYLAYQSIGVIYGDIGTSPLYVFSGVFSSAPSSDDLVGALSLVLWSLLIMVTLKYVVIILHADNEGEGGTFSTYSLLSRYANITERDPREASLIKMERHRTNDIGKANRGIRSVIERSKFVKGLLKVMGVLAVTMVMSDGVLTPAQSVLGAVQGLNVAVPNITDATVVGTTCGILVLLFLIQPLGTSKIATAFAPIVIVWLGFNAGFGIYNLIEHDWRVLRAFNPGEAFGFLARNKTNGWRALGGVLLSFTGVEALFADLGAFSMRAIQLSWLCYTLPCLLLTYLGQAAYISEFPDAYSNPLFNAAPPGMVIPTLIVAVLAAIVASQAIITATFQLLAQIMKLSYFPQIKVVHTSKVYYGQIYVPLANWLLMVGTVIIAAVYNNTTSLGNAYGVCVMFVTFFDTCMVSLAAILVWKINPVWVFFPWLAIASMDGAFLSAALTKVPDGAWFTITLAAVLASLLILWRFGKENQWKAEAADRFPLSYLVRKTPEGEVRLADAFGGTIASPIKGFGIFFDKGGEKTPMVFTQFLSKLMAITDVTVFFHLRPLETPSVPLEQRFTVTRMALPNCYRLVVRHGYNDEIITPNLASLVCEQVRDYVVRRSRHRRPAAPPLSPVQSSAGEPTETSSGEAHTPAIDGEQVSRPATGTISPVHDEKKDKDIMTTVQGKEEASSSSIALPIPSSIRIGSTEKIDASDVTVDETNDEELRKLEAAFARQTIYIVGKEQLRVTSGTGFFRKVLLSTFLWIRDNTRTKIANLRVPTEKVVEVGFVKDIDGAIWASSEAWLGACGSRLEQIYFRTPLEGYVIPHRGMSSLFTTSATSLDQSYFGIARQPSQEGFIPFTPPSLDAACSTYFKVFGDLSAKTSLPLIVLHGGPGAGHEYLLPFAQLWPRFGIPVILYDQIGCAASTHLQHKAGDEVFWTMELFVAELDNLIDTLKIRDGYHILGQSWGGMLASDFAGRRPGGLRRLVLAGAVASFESNVRGVELIRQQLRPEEQAILDEAERTNDWAAAKDVMTALGSKHICRAAQPPPELAPAFKHLSEDSTVYNTMYAEKWVAPKGSLRTWTSIPSLPQITAPTLVYNGEYDSSHDVATRPFFELIPRVRWITFANSGHFSHLEDGGLREKVLTTVGEFLVPPAPP